jgi:DNA-binding CsgD family transcriptional regulator
VDELRVVCVADGLAWATVYFYRTSGDRFGRRDVDVAASTSAPLARAFRHAMLRSACDSSTLDQAPGALLVGADGSIITSSQAAEALLSTVDERDVTSTIGGLAARADASSPSTARLAGRNGLVVLHASAAKGIDGAVSIVVERPRRPQLAPLMMLALGFTERERAVVEQALVGTGRAAIARRLGIAEDTVGDHLTNAYRKAGVGGRAELSALLFGQFYDDPRSRHVPPSPYGYFLTN